MLFFFINTIEVKAHRQHATICTFHNKYICKKIDRNILQNIQLPQEACDLRPCQNCLKSHKTFVLGPDYQLITPETFVIRSSKENTTELIHISEEMTLVNPQRISFQTCAFHYKNQQSSRRHTLEYESALFKTGNLSFQFNDPILHFKEKGKLIVRSIDFEHIYTIPETLIVTLPFELLAFKTVITVIYIHPTGHSITGQLHIGGKSICQNRHCYFCPEFLMHIKCFPIYVAYTIYGILIGFFILLMWFLKTLLKCVLYVFQVIIFSLFCLFKLCKFIIRCSLLLGSYVGTIFRDTFVSGYNFLENHRANAAQIPFHTMLLLSLSLLIYSTNAECNTNEIIKSEIRTCSTSAEGVQNCQMSSTVELTLPTLTSEACLYFTDKNENHLFSLAIKLEAVKCQFHTQRQYFTFPVTARHVAQTSCFYNYYCGQGTHCLKDQIGRDANVFETEIPESTEFPSLTSCVAGGLGSSCFVITRPACNFFRSWYQPDYLRSYEVSKITGYTCKYKVSIRHIENNTVSEVLLSDVAYTSTGVKITILGAYDQPQIQLSEYFIQRVGNPSEGYLAPACEQNIPRVGKLGCVQANRSYTKDFLFDPKLTECDFFEDRLRCTKPRDPVQEMIDTQAFALPLERNLHLFRIEKNTLVSTLLVSAAVRLQLHFNNYKIETRLSTVCPKIDPSEFKIQGCYNCPILARMTFKSVSTCQTGIAFIIFTEIQIHTKAITLNIELKSFTIKFLAEKRCYEEKMCIRAQTLIQCRQLNFCLDEPSIELLNLNTNYSLQTSTASNTNIWSWLSIPNANLSLFVIKFIGSTLFIICLCVTILSTIISCCCRSR